MEVRGRRKIGLDEGYNVFLIVFASVLKMDQYSDIYHYGGTYEEKQGLRELRLHDIVSVLIHFHFTGSSFRQDIFKETSDTYALSRAAGVA